MPMAPLTPPIPNLVVCRVDGLGGVGGQDHLPRTKIQSTINYIVRREYCGTDRLRHELYPSLYCHQVRHPDWEKLVNDKIMPH
jgi:hypothetical protein